MSKVVCVACHRQIDEAAKICPYCGADPVTGAKLDTRAIVEEVFHPREMTRSETLLEYARHRQGIVIGVSVALAFLLLAALHQFVTVRNDSAVTDSPPVPLTEITDLSNQRQETETAPMPDLKFQYEGEPRKMRTFIMEPGAATPPEVIAAQQAAQQAAAPPQAQPQPLPQPQPRPTTATQ